MHYFKPFALLIIVFFLLPKPSQSQQIGTWEAYTSLLSINDIVKDSGGDIWAITEGGLLKWTQNGVPETITPLDGLYRLRPTSIAYEPGTGLIWLGYSDGTIQSFNPENWLFRNLNDIRRNQNFTAKSINRLKFYDGVLYAATGFGMVLIDPDRRIVLDSYLNLGRYTRATGINDFTIHEGMLYVATPLGVAAGNMQSGSLIEPGNWDNSDGAGNLGTLNQAIRAILWFDGRLYAALESGTREFNGQTWVNSGRFSGSVTSFRKSESGQLALSVSGSQITIAAPGSASVNIPIPTGSQFRSVLYDDAQMPVLYAGTRSAGLLRYPQIQQDPEVIRPPGPDNNFFTALNIRDGEFVSASTLGPGRFGLSLDFSGYYLFRDGEWIGFDKSNNEVLATFNYDSSFNSAIAGDYYFFGSWGRGLARHHKTTDEVTVFNASNSPISPISGSNTFTVISGLDSDSEGNLWAAAFLAPSNPLAKYDTQTGEWATFNYPSASGTGNVFFNMMIDSRNLKWIGLLTPDGAGRGLLVWDTSIEGNENAVRLTSNQNDGNLPSDVVNAIVEDRRGEIWIGTNRGVARFLFPDRIIGGTLQDRTASFLINADTTAPSPFLLRDIHATTMAVNAANQKWIGSLNDGLWLIDENGRNVLKHFTTENSPLFSNNITSVAIDDETGMVYVATDEGLMSYLDVVKQESRSMNNLFVFPNPYSYNRETGSVYIEGLSEETMLTILTVDGRMVNRVNTRGGRAEWNVRDYRGERVPTGVYLIVAKDANGSDRGIGKVAIIK